jgi:hypothetical protein
MNWLRNMYKLIHSFFEFLSFKSKPIYIDDDNSEEYEYIFLYENKMTR